MHRGKFRIACIPPSYLCRTFVQILAPGAYLRPLVRYLVCSTTFPTLICISQRTLAYVVVLTPLFFCCLRTFGVCMPDIRSEVGARFQSLVYLVTCYRTNVLNLLTGAYILTARLLNPRERRH